MSADGPRAGPHRSPHGLPQDARVDRRSFVARMSALTAAVAAGTPFTAAAASRPAPRSDATFWRALPEVHAGAVDSPAEHTAWEAGLLLREGRLTAAELTEACLERIERFDATYRAFNTITAEGARARARALDGGGISGPLHGIPLAVKDNFHTAGVRTTANSHIFRELVPDTDATAVARLAEAGGIVLGKTQMGPLATTRALTPDGEITTVNAWAPGDPDVSPGGSSSGSATAVAGRLALSAIGTQTGGSITVPSQAQGLTGLKPTFGRVSLRGVIPLTYSRDHVGPLARDGRDAALMLQAMAGPDPADPRTQGLPPVPDYLAAATPVERDGRPILRWGTRIGVPDGWADGDGARADRRRAFLLEMEDAGGEIVPLEIPERWTELSSGTFNAVRLPERSEPFLEWLREDVRLFGVTLASWIQGLLLSGDEYLKGQRAKLALLRLTLEEIFERCDVVAQPGHVPFDMIGLPLLSLPVGFEETDSGPRPDAVLLGAAPFGEERLLSLAAAWQARTEHHLRRPPDPDPAEEARMRAPGRRARGRLDVEDVARLSE